MSLMVVVGLVGGGAFAYFSDTETSSGNTFTAGSLDLAMSNGSGWQNPYATGTIVTESNTEPGKEVGPYDVYFKNVGSLEGKVFVNISVSGDSDVPLANQVDVLGNFAEYADNQPKGTNVTSENYAKKLVVTRAYLDGTSTNVADYWAQQSINEGGLVATGEVVVNSASSTGYSPTIYGLSKITLHFANGIPPAADWKWAIGEEHSEVFYLKLAEDGGNDFQYDGIAMTLKASLLQYGDTTTVPSTLP
jgi:spore coat-associated protein N